MKRAVRIATVTLALAAAFAFSTPSAAQGEVRVEGRFRLPHGEIAIGVGDPYDDRYRNVDYGAPAYPIGSYLPYGYRVVEDPDLGYGFYSPAFACRVHHIHHRHWVPVRRYATRWVVIERPVFGRRYSGRRYDRRDGYRRYDDRRYSDRRSDDRRYRRQSDGAHSGDPYYDFNREYWDRGYHPYDDPRFSPRPYDRR